MQQQFVIQTVETNLIEKKIIVTTNNTIDPNSIDDIFIQIMERETRSEVMFTKKIIGQNLEVTLTQWPIPNTAYIFYLKSLTNILGEPVRAGVKRKIEFKSTITKEVDIVSPSMFETVKELNIKFNHKDKTDIKEEDNKNYYTYIEISTDNEFYNIVKSTKVKEKNEINITGLNNGQYYLRARVESDDKEFQYGMWSEIVSFIYGKAKPTETDEKPEIDYTPEFEDMTEICPEIDDIAKFEVSEILCQEGTTPDEVLKLLLSKNIDEDHFDRSQIIITRKDMR